MNAGGENGALIQCWWGCTLAQDPLEINLENPQEMKVHLPCDLAITTPWHMPKGLSILVYGYLLGHTHG